MNQTQAKHTPGPILIEGPFPPRKLGMLPSVKATWDGRMLQLFAEDFEQAEVDMRLIAAAPELLEALKDILAAYHGLTLGRQDTEWEGQFKVKARAAIQKAEGQA